MAFIRLIVQVLVFLALFTFGFGEQDEEALSVAISNEYFLSSYKPIILDVRYYLPIIFGLALFLGKLLGVNHRKMVPLVYVLVSVHFIVAVKYSFYAGEIFWKGALNIMAVYLVAAFCDLAFQLLQRSGVERVALIALVAALIIVYSSIGFDLSLDTSRRYVYQYGNPNHAGVGLASLLLLYLSAQESARILDKVISIIILPLTLYPVILTGSRTALTGIIVFLFLRYTRLGLFFSAVFLLCASAVIYVLAVGEYWEGRDDRIILWLNEFNRRDFDFVVGADFGVRRPFLEGFLVTLPYSIGIFGFILLLAFIVFYGRLVYMAISSSRAAPELFNSFPFLVAFAWMSLFESIPLGILTQPIFAFWLIVAWQQRYSRAIDTVNNGACDVFSKESRVSFSGASEKRR